MKNFYVSILLFVISIVYSQEKQISNTISTAQSSFVKNNDSLLKREIINIQAEVKRLKDTLKAHQNHYKSIEGHEIIEKVNNFYDSAWNKLIFTLGFFGTLAGIVLPLVISWYQQRNFNNLVDSRVEEFNTKIQQLISSNEETIRLLSENIDSQISDLSNQNSIELQSINTTFAEKINLIDNALKISNKAFIDKTAELEIDIDNKVITIECNFWLNVARNNIKAENYILAVAYYFVSLGKMQERHFKETEFQTKIVNELVWAFEKISNKEELGKVDIAIKAASKEYSISEVISLLKNSPDYSSSEEYLDKIEKHIDSIK